MDSIISKEDIEKLFNIIKEELKIDPSQIDPNKNFIFELGLDSLQLATIAARIDTEFDINLPLTVMEATNLNEFLYILKNEIEEKNT